MMSTATADYIEVDATGSAKVAGTRFHVYEIARYGWRGLPADEIRRQHPSLSREQVDAALAYYGEHPAPIDVEIGRAVREFQKNRADEDAKFAEEMAANKRAYAEQREAIHPDYTGKYVGFAFGRVVAVSDDMDVAWAVVDARDPPPLSFSIFRVDDDPIFEPDFEPFEDYRGGAASA